MPKVWWELETDCAVVEFPNKKPIKLSRELLYDLGKPQTEKHMAIGTTTGQLQANMKEYWENVYNKWQDQCFIIPPVSPPNPQANLMITKEQNQAKSSFLRRLTTSGEWTICVNEQDKLVAFNGMGEHLVAEGSLLSVDGKAWLLHCGRLWSGELARVETEKEKATREHYEKSKKASEKRRKVEEKYEEKFAKIEQQRREELDRVSQEP